MRNNPLFFRCLLLSVFGLLTAVEGGEIHVITTGAEASPDGLGSFAWTGPFSDPVLGEDGIAVFTASLDDSGNAHRGLFLGGSTGVIALLRRGEPSPLLVPPNDSFDQFYGGAWSPDGSVTFSADIVNNGNRGAIFRQTSTDGLSRLFRDGDPYPGGGAMYLNLNRRPTQNAAGQVATGVSLSGTIGGSSDDYAIVRLNSNGTATVIAQEGAPMPDGNGTISPYTAANPALNDLGEVAFLASVSGQQSVSAIIRGDGGTPVVVARSGTPLPGGGTINGFEAVSEVALNDSGVAAFAFSTDIDSTLEGIGKGRSTPTLQILAQAGQRTPENDGIFIGFGRHPRINDAGNVAFIAGVDPDVGVGTFDALYLNDTRVAYENQPSPRADGAWINGLNSGSFALNETGTVAFIADSDSATTQGTAIYIHQSGGSLAEVIRTGDPFLGGTLFELGFLGTSPSASIPPERDGLNESGQIAFWFRLSGAENFRQGVAIWSPFPLRGRAGHLSILRRPDGAEITFKGFPHVSYQLQRSPTLHPPWSNVGSPLLTTAADGTIRFQDNTPPAGIAPFYQVVFGR